MIVGLETRLAASNGVSLVISAANAVVTWCVAARMFVLNQLNASQTVQESIPATRVAVQ